MSYFCPVEGIDVDDVVIEGVPAMSITISERLLASWSEWMATQVVLYFYEDDDGPHVEFEPEDGLLDD